MSQNQIYEKPQHLDENFSPDVSSEINTNFVEERVVETREAFPSTFMSIPKSIEAEMADGTWMARNQLLKPMQVSQVDWSTTQTRGTSIVELIYPNLLAKQESLVLRTLRMYAFYRISPIFRIQINATVFHQGQLICSFDPFSLCSTGTIYPFSIFYASGLPNVKIMASFSDAVELKIPFIHPRSFLTTNTKEAYNTIGTFRVTVLNPLIAAEGASPTLSVTTWLYGANAQVHVPIQDHNPILNSNLVEEEFEITSLMSDIVDEGKKLIGQGKQVYDKSSDIVGNIMTGNIGQALRKGQGLVDTLGEIFGFDYPARTIQPSKSISPIENLAVAKGVSQSQRLALDPFSLHNVYDEIASETKDAMNLKNIIMTPMLLTQFQFDSTQARGTILKSIPINPCVSPKIAGEKIQRTYLSYVSNAFAYWSGGIVYDIEVVATKFHSGKLLFAYIPNVNDPPSYEASSDSLPNIILDIQQTSSFRFTVPYTSSTSLKNTLYFNDKAALSTIVDTCTGTLVCYVQNTLAFASNVSPSIEINIYVSASSDFNLYVPQHPSFNRFTKTEEFEATSVVLNENKNQSSSGPTLSFGPSFSVNRLMFGEDYSLFDLIKRFSPMITESLTLEKPGAAFFVSPNIDSTYLQYWSRIYNCWCGSIRYKFMARTNRTVDTTLNVVHIPNFIGNFSNGDTQAATADMDLWGYAMARTQLAQDCALEVEVPYYSRFNMLVNTEASIGDFDIIQNGTIFVTAKQLKEDLALDAFTAAGDDFRFIYPRPPPLDSSNILSVTTIA